MNFLYFRISGGEIVFDDITKTLGIAPELSYKAGEKRLYRGKTVVYAEDCWLTGIEIERPEETEERLLGFVNLLYEHAAAVASLTQKHSATLWLTVYPEGVQYNLHIPSKTMGKLSEMGVSLGVTYMQLKEFYDGTYV